MVFGSSSVVKNKSNVSTTIPTTAIYFEKCGTQSIFNRMEKVGFFRKKVRFSEGDNSV